jgi:hypothetical protein
MLSEAEIERAVARAIDALSLVSFDECYIFAITRKFGDVGVKIEKTHNMSPEGLSLLAKSVNELVAKSFSTVVEYKDGRIEENGKLVELEKTEDAVRGRLIDVNYTKPGDEQD